MAPNYSCLCCGSSGPFSELTALEMMFGWREPFTSLECGACHSLQLSEVPADLARFYPANYYSLSVPSTLIHAPSRARALAATLLTLPVFRPLLRRLRNRYDFLHWIGLSGVKRHHRILDVGCGSGVLLRRLRRWGYQHLTGVDPFMGTELHEPGLDLYCRELADLTDHFDLVMMHHVLEHLPDPVAALKLAAARLAPEGKLLVRLPVAGGPLTREYGPHWFALDPPRHLVIPSREGLLRCFERAGLQLVREEFDSTAQHIYYSDCYRRNVAMREAVPFEKAPDDPAARGRIAALNAAKQSDSGLFVLKAR